MQGMYSINFLEIEELASHITLTHMVDFIKIKNLPKMNSLTSIHIHICVIIIS